MRKYNIFAGVSTNNYKHSCLKGLDFENEEEALEYAEEYAKDLYNLNPVLDVVELIFLSGIDEDTAMLEFKKQMIANIGFYIEEVK